MEFISLAILMLLGILLVAWLELKGTSGMPPRLSFFKFIINIPIILKESMYKGLVVCGQKLGGIYFFRVFGNDYVVINDWAIMKEALVGQSDVFAGRPKMYVAKQMLQDTDILFIDGPTLKEKRRFTLFHLRRFGFGKTSMESVILDEISRLLETLDKKTEQKMTMNDLFNMSVLNVLLGIITAKQYDYDNLEMQHIGQHIKSFFHFLNESIVVNFYPMFRFVPYFSYVTRKTIESAEQIKTYFNKEIDEHLKSLEDSEPKDFLDVYLKEISKQKTTYSKKLAPTNCFTREHLVGTAFDILQAGIETTVSTLEWTLMYMAIWPEIQTKIQKELDSAIGRNRWPTYADYSLLPYLEATILEIHRFTSVIPLSGPHRAVQTTKLAGYTIPKDTIVIQNIWAVHNDEQLWGDPKVFRPERFLDANGKVQKPEYLIPFSIGARRCIGESLTRIELFLVIACLLQRYTFSYPTGEVPPSLKTVSSITRPPGHFHLILKLRS